MTTETKEPRTQLVRYRLDVHQYLKMIEIGIFPSRARVELLNGILVRKTTRNPPHDFAVRQLGDKLRTLIPEGWIISEEKPLVLGEYWRPEPDFAIVRGPGSLNRERDPETADIGLVIEVSDSSYTRDRGSKWRRYAEAKIQTYWIVNLSQSRVEVYTDPEGQGRSASYRQCSTFGPDQSAPIVIEGVEVGQVLVCDLLPLRKP